MSLWTKRNLVESAAGSLWGSGRRQIPWRIRVVALISFCAFALDHPFARSQGLNEGSPPVSQQVMSQSWSVQQGAPDSIQTIAQTADGILWLGTAGGLFRFDGTRFERFRALSGDQLLSTHVFSLFAPPSGGLWVGYQFGGFSFLKNGQVKNYGGRVAATTATVYTLAQDSHGTIWAGTGSGVWRFDGSNWQELGPEWDAPSGFSILGIDRADTIWVCTGVSKEYKLAYLTPGSKRFREVRPRGEFYGFTLDADQKVLTSPIEPAQAPNAKTGSGDGVQVYPIFGENGAQIVDRTNAVWTVSKSDQLTRLAVSPWGNNAEPARDARKPETYSVSPSPYMRAALADHEGNIWFADREGIDRFFYAPFFKEELPVKKNAAMAADDDGAVWVAFWSNRTCNELYRVTRERIETLGVRDKTDWGAVYRATDKTFWFGGRSGLWHLSRGKLVQVGLPEGMAEYAFYLQAITEDRGGGLLISFGRYGLFRYANGVWTSFVPSKGLTKGGPLVEFTDNLGRVWFGYSGSRKGRIALLDGEKVRVFGERDGAPVGNVTAIAGRGSDVWIGSEFGLDRFDGKSFHRIHAVDDDWLLGISGIVERADGDLWLNGVSGIFHIRSTELSKALEDPYYRVKGEHLGGRDGLPGSAEQDRPLETAIEGSDGRLWFSLRSGVVWLDPNRAQHRPIVPPITIQAVTADDKVYEADLPLTFPAHTSSVVINYSAISLSDPEAVRSRIRLQETDPRWREVATGEPVSYRNLAPGHYHFTVGASNTDGVWLDKVTTLDFTILPAWYQTNWFRALCVVSFLFCLWLLYQLRLRQLHHQFQIGLEAQVSERTRIARELHDTMLQSFQGLLLRFQTVSNLLPARPEEAKTRIDSVIEEGSNAITAGRDAVHELRSMGLQSVNLAESIRDFARELLDNLSSANLPEFRIQVEGSPKALNPVIRDEVYRIAAEALRNAIRHSGAKRIEVEVRYDEENLKLGVRDDGKGIDESVLQKEYAPGHWGLRGMRERAKLAGGELELWSKPESGTEIQVKIHAMSAYSKALDSQRSFFARTLRS
jgi:signal transduction histidine kinase/ligand-binding sensor domain-containing protein